MRKRDLEDKVLDELLPDWHEVFYNSDTKVKCDCDMPHVRRSGSQALGYVLDIDLCCLAKAVEELTGKRFYHFTRTKPAFEWDFQKDGAPPPWMLSRMRDVGYDIPPSRPVSNG